MMRVGDTRRMKNGGTFTMTNARLVGNKRAGDKRRGVRFRPLVIHPHAHALVREFVALLNAERLTLTEIAARSGIRRPVMHRWRIRSNPTIAMFEAALNAAGYELRIARRRKSDE